MPGSSNFFARVTTKESVESIVERYRLAGWRVGRCSASDYEVRCDSAELIIERNAPVLIHGLVVDPVINAPAIIKPIMDAGISFIYECYAADDTLLVEVSWPPDAPCAGDHQQARS